MNVLNPQTHLPGLCTWKKDSHSRFLEISGHFAELLGFKTPEQALGCRDDDIPCRYRELADQFRAADQQVMQAQQVQHFLEIQQFANQEWKALYVVKAPYYEQNQLCGTMGYCVDITAPFVRLDQFLRQPQKSFQAYSAHNPPKLSARESETLFFLNTRPNL